MKGIFITFEGIDGCGKTTQIKLFADYLRSKNHDFILTREPGGTPIGDKIRAILLDAAHDKMTPLAELLLYAAARNQHIEQVIKPALQAGKIVLCDRYADATTAYQGAARQISSDIIEKTHEVATGGLKPDITVLLDMSPEEALKRARDRNEREDATMAEGRFESEKMDFHKRVRNGYLAIAKEEPKRFIVIDASKSVEEMQEDIIREVKI